MLELENIVCLKKDAILKMKLGEGLAYLAASFEKENGDCTETNRIGEDENRGIRSEKSCRQSVLYAEGPDG